MSSQRKRSGLFLFFLLRFFAGAAALLRSWGLRALRLRVFRLDRIGAGLAGRGLALCIKDVGFFMSGSVSHFGPPCHNSCVVSIFVLH